MMKTNKSLECHLQIIYEHIHILFHFPSCFMFASSQILHPALCYGSFSWVLRWRHGGVRNSIISPPGASLSASNAIGSEQLLTKFLNHQLLNKTNWKQLNGIDWLIDWLLRSTLPVSYINLIGEAAWVVAPNDSFLSISHVFHIDFMVESARIVVPLRHFFGCILIP